MQPMGMKYDLLFGMHMTVLVVRAKALKVGWVIYFSAPEGQTD